jgi:hypothetical protein
MSTREDPSRQRRRLRVELRRVRDAAGLTQRQAVEQLEWSLSKLIRIEAGTVGVSGAGRQPDRGGPRQQGAVVVESVPGEHHAPVRAVPGA